MSDESRPRPQYGEYATPEEQRARMGLGPADAPAAPSYVAPEMSPAVSPAQAVHPAPHLAAPRPTTTAARPTRFADRIITAALLGYGLITVLGAIPQLIDIVAFTDAWMETAGIEATLSDPAGARAWGITAAVLLAVGWLATALLSWWSLSHRRLSWWIPLVGAIVSFIITSLCLTVPLISDPSILEGVARVAG